MGLGQLRVELSPPDMLGRVITVGGAVADALPAADVVVIGSVAGLVTAALLARRPLASAP